MKTLDLISTAPNVVYDVVMEDGTEVEVTNPSEFPEGKIHEVREPVVKATILSPSDYIGTIMELCQAKRGQLGGIQHRRVDTLTAERRHQVRRIADQGQPRTSIPAVSDRQRMDRTRHESIVAGPEQVTDRFGESLEFFQ